MGAGAGEIRTWAHRARPIALHWSGLAVFGAALAAAFLISHTVGRQVEERDRRRIEDKAERAGELLYRSIQDHVLILEAARGLIAASESVEPYEWDIFVRGILADRGPEELHWVARFPGPESAWRGDALPTLLAGADGEGGAEGWTVDRAAAERARDLRTPVLSRVRVADGAPGARLVTLFLPTYGQRAPPGTPQERRAAHDGWVAACIAVEEMAARALAPLPASVAAELYECADADPASLLFAGQAQARPAAPEGLSCGRILHLPGVAWSLRARALPAFFPPAERALDELTLALGVLASGLLGLLAAVLAAWRRMARRAARESEEMYRLLFERSADGIFLMSDIFEDCNPRVCEIWGVGREEVIGHSPVDFSPPLQPDGRPSAEAAAERIGAALAGRPQLFEWRHLHRDGRPVDTEISLVGVQVRGRPMLLATMRDVGARKQAELELQQARAAAIAADRAKGQFLANMSHEIRTPMNGILGVTELLLDGEASEQQREHLKVVRSCAESLMRVINDVLDFSKIEAGRLELECEPFEPAEVAREALGTLALGARRKGIDLALDVSPGAPRTLLGDAMRLRQVLLNLAGNALKFTERGSVRVLIAPDARRPGWLHIAVRDTGVGIPADQQARVFEAFAQGDGATARRHGGTGLGLSISSQLVRLMDGEIALESEVGVGSTFHVRLPPRAGESRAEEPAAA
ncbi:MAG: PAS domain S-box protein [Candidatus Eisenbacteria bacterium]|uniref:Sensory/regulatory protein RpfC n=1 Tax=Eiseniibacteriota bacterium TaxID=2212470 RepID=A0A938BQ59_UNCEI|nr:PAS domain S-box protein [Candidatus Eisenbacteria bacterium]